MRETKAQKVTRVSLLLAEYDETSRALRKLSKRADELKSEIRENVEPGTYGEWIRSDGTPREILDQPKARELMKLYGIDVPTLMTAPPVIVTHVASTK